MPPTSRWLSSPSHPSLSLSYSLTSSGSVLFFKQFNKWHNVNWKAFEARSLIKLIEASLARAPLLMMGPRPGQQANASIENWPTSRSSWAHTNALVLKHFVPRPNDRTVTVTVARWLALMSTIKKIIEKNSCVRIAEDSIPWRIILMTFTINVYNCNSVVEL